MLERRAVQRMSPGTAVHAKSPLRLGLAGGGTDVSPYSDRFGGLVLNAAISLYSHCEIRVLDSPTIRFLAADFDELVELPLHEDVPMTGPLLLHRGVYNRIVRQFNAGKPLPVEVITYSDAPPGSGVGSSSGLVVAMVCAYCELLHLPLGEYELAHLAYEIERVDCGLAGGKQDQYAATFGGFNFMEFGAGDRVIINPLRVRDELANELESRLLLYFTGRSRDSANIIRSQVAASSSLQADSISASHELKAAAVTMKDALLRGRINDVLRILCASWITKKRLAMEISNSHIELIAEAATVAGALGVKVSGAGGGGFMMIAVDPQHRFSVIKALKPMSGQFFAFSFEFRGVQSWTIS